MTISADYAPGIDMGNGVTTAFPINFPFSAKAEVAITLYDTSAAANVSPAPVMNGAGAIDYVISGSADANTGIFPNGTVTFNSAPPSSYKVVRERATAQRQNASLTNNGPFPAKTVEGAFDRQEMQLQERSDGLARAIIAPAAAQAGSLVIPTAFFGGGKLLSYDEAEDELTVEDPMVEQAQEAAAEAIAAAASVSDLWFRPVLDRIKTPPTSPASGDRYLVHRTGPTGAFIGKENQVAEWNGTTWLFTGAPLAGQMISLLGVLYQYQPGREDEVSSYFWRQYDGRKVTVAAAPTVFSFGDSIFLTPNTTDCFPARVAAELGGTNDNQAVSGKGIWNAAWHVFAKPQADTAKGNYLHQFGAGHNNCIYTADIAKNATTVFNEMMAVLAFLFGTFQPASALTPVGSWTTDTGDALGVKPIANQSGGGSLLYSSSVGAQLNGSFTGERFILHALRGDGVLANRCSDIAITIDGSSRTPFVDDGDFEFQTFEGTHIGHAVLVDNKWGKGTHNFTLEVGANATATRPAYIDGVTSLRPPAQCTPLVVHLPLRPNDLTPTTTVGTATATSETFRAAEDAIRKALAYFPEYPWTIVDPNTWVDGVGDFADHEHPSGAGANRYMWAVQDRLVKGQFQAKGTYTPVASGLVNADSATPGIARWARNGNTVVVSGTIVINCTADNADTGVELTLPLASDLTATEDCEGSGAAYTAVQQALGIGANTTSNHAWLLFFNTAGTGDVTYRYMFQYEVK